MGVTQVEAVPRRTRAHAGPSAAACVLVGAVSGLAWGAAFRAFMAEIAGGASRFEWYGTFVAVLGAAVITGALLGLAEYFRRTGGRRHWRWLALAPLSFAILPLTMPGALLALFTQGLGGGAIAIAIVAVAGGFAVSGRGPLWGRFACGILTLAVIGGAIATVPAVGGIRLALDQPRGVWVATLAASCIAVLCLATSIPFRRVERPAEAPTQPLEDGGAR